MIIRATKKLLNTSGIEATKDLSPLKDELPGEWYATLVSMGSPGKLAIYFLHYPTLITLIIPGKSLNKALLLLPHKIASFLQRHGYLKLLPDFQIHTDNLIYTTNSKNILGYLNDQKFTIEYHLARNKPLEAIEDIEYRNIFGGKLVKGGHIIPEKVLKEYL